MRPSPQRRGATGCRKRFFSTTSSLTPASTNRATRGARSFALPSQACYAPPPWTKPLRPADEATLRKDRDKQLAAAVEKLRGDRPDIYPVRVDIIAGNLDLNRTRSSHKLQPSVRVLCETLSHCGDPELAFTARLELPSASDATPAAR